MYAAMLINICSVGGDGKTTYERDVRARSSKGNCLNSVRAYGISSQGQLAKTSSTKHGEAQFMWDLLRNHVSCAFEQMRGFTKVRTFVRRGEPDRWRKTEMNEMIGVPRELVPGRGMKEVRSRVHLAEVGCGEDVILEPQIRQVVARRMRFNMEDLGK